MNAIEFVKKFGWTKAKECLSFGKNYTDADLVARYADLKQIVDAFELVEAHGGLDGMRDFVKENGYTHTEFGAHALKAIELVEKCNASD